MSNIENILDDLNYLQTKIPEHLFKIKDKLQNLELTIEDIKQHPYGQYLLKKNKSLRKTNNKLEKKLLYILLKEDKEKTSKNSKEEKSVVVKKEVIVIMIR